MCDDITVLTSDLFLSDCDEDGESAERCCSSHSRHAACSPGAFWEGSVCLSGSQGNVSHVTVTSLGGGVVVKRLIGCLLPPQDSPSLSASDWAVAVCHHLGGSAGGSTLVAKGTGRSSDITDALRWAEEFARNKIQR